MGKNPMSCGAECSRITLIALNVIFLLLGIALFVIGLVFRFGDQELKDDIKPAFDGIEINNYDFFELVNSLSIIFIVVGAIIIVFSIIGFIGAVCYVRVALVLYAILIGLCLALQLAAVILFFIVRNELEEKLQDGMVKVIEKANNGDSDARKGIEYMFDKFECCHVNGVYYDGSTKCRVVADAFRVDCYESFTDWLEQYRIALIVVGIIAMVIQVLLIILSCWLCRVASKRNTMV